MGLPLENESVTEVDDTRKLEVAVLHPAIASIAKSAKIDNSKSPERAFFKTVGKNHDQVHWRD
jgi:hypothetical protein